MTLRTPMRYKLTDKLTLKLLTHVYHSSAFMSFDPPPPKKLCGVQRQIGVYIIYFSKAGSVLRM
jgi:hypothetical protein